MCGHQAATFPGIPNIPDIPGSPDSKVFEEESFHIKNGRLYDFKAPTFMDHGSRTTVHGSRSAVCGKNDVMKINDDPLYSLLLPSVRSRCLWG